MIIQQILYILLIFASLSAYGLNLRINDPEKCADLCTSCNGVPSFIDDQCECEIAEANEQVAECITNLQKSLDSNPNLVDHMDLDEERSARCTLGLRRHLRKEDANKVAKYFLNGGPAAGVTHFIPSTYQQPVPETEEDCDDSSNESDDSDDSDDFNSDTVAAAVPTSQSKQSSKNVKGQFVDTTAYRAIPASSYALPAIPTILGSPQYLIPHTLPASRFKPRLHPLPGLLHLPTLQNIPQHLFRFVKFPVQGLVGLSNIITHGLTSSVPPYYNGVEQNVLGSALTNQLSTQSTKQDPDTGIEKSRNRQGINNISNRRRTGAATKKQNIPQEENIVGAPIAVNTQTAQNGPLFQLTNPTYGGYFLQLIPGDQHNALPNTVVGSPYTENLPLCRDPKISDVVLSKSDSSQTDDVDESTDDSTDKNDKETNGENIRITRRVSDQRIERR